MIKRGTYGEGMSEEGVCGTAGGGEEAGRQCVVVAIYKTIVCELLHSNLSSLKHIITFIRSNHVFIFAQI